MFYKIQYESSANKWFISSAAQLRVKQFLISCESEEEALFYRGYLADEKLLIPTANAGQYEKIRDLSSDQVDVFKVGSIFKAVKRNADGQVIEERKGLTYEQASSIATQFGNDEDNQFESFTIELQ